MSLSNVPRLRKASIIGVVGTVVFLVLAAEFPRLTFALAILALLFYYLPYVFLVYVMPRRRRQSMSHGIYVRELTPEAVKGWYDTGRITREEYDRMMKNLGDGQSGSEN